MLSINLKELTKISLVASIIGVMIFGYFCINTLNHKMDMEMTDGTPSIVKSVESCCNTTFSRHSEFLKSNFTFPPRAGDYLLAFIVSIILVFIVNLYYRNSEVSVSILYRLYLRQNPNFFAFDSIKLAFSNGIINPKVF